MLINYTNDCLCIKMNTNTKYFRTPIKLKNRNTFKKSTKNNAALPAALRLLSSTVNSYELHTFQNKTFPLQKSPEIKAKQKQCNFKHMKAEINKALYTEILGWFTMLLYCQPLFKCIM